MSTALSALSKRSMRTPMPSESSNSLPTPEWKGGAKVETTFPGGIQGGKHLKRDTPHTWTGDEPPALAGTGTAQGPTDSILHAMSHCLTVTTVYQAAARGIPIEKFKVKAEGDLDLQGFLGLNPKVKPGFKNIHLQVYMDSPSETKDVYDLFRFAQGHSPVCSTVRGPVDFQFDYSDVKVVDPADGYKEGDDDMRHGVSYEALVNTVAAVKADPKVAKGVFMTETEWKDGAQVETTFSGFEMPPGTPHTRETPIKLVTDEPTILLGKDAGPGPTETALHAVGNCISVTNSYHSAIRGIKMHEFSLGFDGDVDLRGFCDLDDNVPPGYTAIRVKVHARASGCTQDELMAYVQSIPGMSPICHTVEKPVNVTFGLTHNGKQVSDIH